MSVKKFILFLVCLFIGGRLMMSIVFRSFMMNDIGGESLGVIGGADGPTAIFLASSQGGYMKMAVSFIIFMTIGMFFYKVFLQSRRR